MKAVVFYAPHGALKVEELPTGNPVVQQQTFASLRTGGRFVMIGYSAKPIPWVMCCENETGDSDW